LPIELLFEEEIGCSAERLFDLIVDLRGQEQWLGRSSSYHGTEALSSNPAVLGTTYREPGPLGVRNGTVTEFDRPGNVAFHQPMTLRFGLGTIDILMRYTLAERPSATRVKRTVTIALPRTLKLFRPVLVREFKVENVRTLAALKAHAEGQSGP
jgi:hypothetical protein